MLLPFQWVVLTLEEAKTLMRFIETSTATKTIPIHYEKMRKFGILETYEKLRQFVEASHQYDYHLRNLDSGELVSFYDLPNRS